MAKKLMSYIDPVSGIKKLFASGDPKKLTVGEADCRCCDCLCSICSGSVPCVLEVVLAGFGTGSCGDCACFNDTFILSYTSGDANNCYWDYSPGCCDHTIRAQLSLIGGVPALNVYVLPRTYPFGPAWGDFVSADCSSWSGISLTPAAVGLFVCDWSTATCTVTAL